MDRGTIVVVRAYRDAMLERRVWEDSGDGVLLCSEDEYERALATGDEPLSSGFPKNDIVNVASST